MTIYLLGAYGDMGGFSSIHTYTTDKSLADYYVRRGDTWHFSVEVQLNDIKKLPIPEYERKEAPQ